MTHRISGIFFASLLIATAFAPHTLAQGPVGHGARRFVIEVGGLRNDRGTLVGALYASPDGWLLEGSAVESCHARIRGGVARCAFAVPAARRVAFAAYHDEDDDRIFDRGVFGIPQEGYAFSNDAREALSAPSFAAAAFPVPAAAPVGVRMRYGL